MVPPDPVFELANAPQDGRPFLLIDVDGVLNAINRNQGNRTYRIQEVVGFRVRLRHELNDWLFELTDHYVPVWCTMWNDEANTSLSPLLGLPSLSYIPCKGPSRRAVMWNDRVMHHKLDAVERHMSDAPFAWLDDEFTKDDLAWAEARNQSVAPTRFLKTDQRQGLLRHHIDKLVTWAQGLKVEGA